MRLRALATLLALAAAAHAGSSADPEAPDATGDSKSSFGHHDALGAWFEADARGLTLAIAVASWQPDESVPGTLNLDFRLDGTPYEAGIFTNGLAAFYRPGGSAETYNTLATVEPGAPATFRLTVGRHVAPAVTGSVASFRDVRAWTPGVATWDVVATPGRTFVTPEIPPVPVGVASTYQGRFLVGDEGASLSYACGDPSKEGVNSNCVELAPTDLGNRFALTGSSVDVYPCFLDGNGALLECGGVTRIPDEAAYVEILGGGVDIEWRLDTWP